MKAKMRRLRNRCLLCSFAICLMSVSWQLRTGALAQAPAPIGSDKSLPCGAVLRLGKPSADKSDLVDSLAFSPDGKALVASSCDGTIRLWEVGTGRLKALWEQHAGHVSFCFGGTQLVYATGDCVCLWKIADARVIRRFRLTARFETSAWAHRPGIEAFALYEDEKVLYATASGLLYGHKLTGRVPDRTQENPRSRSVVEYSTFNSWDVRTGQPLAECREDHVHQDPVDDVNGRWVNQDGSPLEDGQKQPGLTIRFSRDGQFSITDMGVVRENATGKRIAHLKEGDDDGITGKRIAHLKEGDDDGITTIGWWVFRTAAFSEDDRLLAAPVHGTDCDYLKVWELATGRPAFVVQAKGQLGGFQMFSPNGRVLVSMRPDGFLFSDIVTGERLRWIETTGILEPLTIPVVARFAISPDGRRLATAMPNATILLWDLGDVKEFQAPMRKRVSPAELNKLWIDLRNSDARKGLAAAWALAEAAEQSMPLIAQQVKPQIAPTPARLRRLIDELDAPRFSTRENAFRELRRLRESAAPRLRSELERKPSLEKSNRLNALLRQSESLRLAEDDLRDVRALQVLEIVGTPKAGEILRTLASGDPNGRFTRDAQATLRRTCRKLARTR